MDETSIVSPNKSIGSDLDSYSYIFDYIIKFIKFYLINNKINYKNEIKYEKIHHFILNNKINYKNLVKFSKDKFYDYKTCELLFKLILKGNITLNNISVYQTSYGGCVGMSGGPLINTETGEILGIMSFGLPKDSFDKTNLFSISIDEIRSKT